MNYTLSTRRRFLKALAATIAGGAGAARVRSALAADEAALAALRFRADDPQSVRRLREQYLLAPGLVYLNHASIGTVPRTVHEAHVGYLELCESNPSLYVWGRPWREAAAAVREAAGGLLGARPEDLAITHNTTEGFNVLAQGLPLGAGDEVLFSSLNHPGASVPWERQAARRGFAVRRFSFPMEEAPGLTDDDVVRIHVEAIGPETRVLVVPHVDNMIGLRHPLPRLAAAVRAHGVETVLVDGAQSAGMIPVDLSRAGVDAYAMSPHKWLQAPKGLGLFWTTPRLREALPPLWYRSGGPELPPHSLRFEDYSTRAWPAVVALGDALDVHAAVPLEERVRRSRRLHDLVREMVDADPGLAWRSPREWKNGSLIMAVRAAGRDAPSLGRELAAANVSVRAFPPPLDTIRISPNLATSEGEFRSALRRMSAPVR